MLTTLLPGIREIRTPLAVGYAWLITFWLAFGYRAPRPGAAHGFLADVYRLAHAGGPAAVGVVVSVGAYVLGVIATELGLAITYEMGDLLRKTPLRTATPGARREKRVRSALDDTIAARLAQRLGEDEILSASVMDLTEFGEDEIRDAYESVVREDFWLRFAIVKEVVDRDESVADLHVELDAVADRIRGSGDMAVVEYDRLQAEAEFRLAMFGPLAALCIVAGIRWSPLAFPLLPLLVMLLYVGVGARTQAEAGIARMLMSGRVTDPALERLAAATVRFKSAWPPSQASTTSSETESIAAGPTTAVVPIVEP